ncbi:glycosyltransferase family 2 protein, partial [Candidatus Gottesmanbacteria bacterium]|nr:glycosyltransferase family 2 protein [Candidatus Gottesmanbacteria bacterium]
MGKTIGKRLSSLSFLIPAYNDEATIEKALAEAVAVGKRVAKKFEVVLLDDGSQVQVATGLHPVRLVTHTVNQGYGKTIKELYYAGKYEWLFTIPGDYQVGAKELEKLIPFSHHSDMILGWRMNRRDPPNRLIVSRMYNTLIRLLFGVRLHDVNSVRLMRRSILKDIRLTASSAFVDAELVIRAKRAGFHVIEAPIAHRPRQGS